MIYGHGLAMSDIWGTHPRGDMTTDWTLLITLCGGCNLCQSFSAKKIYWLQKIFICGTQKKNTIYLQCGVYVHYFGSIQINWNALEGCLFMMNKSLSGSTFMGYLLGYSFFHFNPKDQYHGTVRCIPKPWMEKELFADLLDFLAQAEIPMLS